MVSYHLSLSLFTLTFRYAIIIDYVGEIEGINARLLRANEVRKHLEQSLAIDDSDPTTWHILGIEISLLFNIRSLLIPVRFLGVWHYSFADMPYYKRLAAKTIFTAPPESTYHEAWEHFKKAESIRPNFYSKNTW